ncbi:MAG: hypothetical protein H6918_08535 [Sphingomonadaceae bacterium]|nr:hypothetical protein [Sphingomonadaceae bacterium]
MLASACVAVPAHGQSIPEEEITDLDSLGGDRSGAFGTNSNGSIVFGYAEQADGTIRLVLWRDGVVQDITPDGASFSPAVFDRNGVRRFYMSRDGSTVTGTFVPAGQSQISAVIIRNGVAEAMTGSDYILPTAISGNGLVIGGTASPSFGVTQPFSYDQNGLHWLPTLNRGTGSSAAINAINADGSVLVGSDATGPARAVRWVNGNIEDLGVLQNGITSFASDVSDDGNVVVGTSQVEFSPGAYQPRAFIWQDGVMTPLGVLNNTGVAGNDQSVASAVSGDGTTVIGHGRTANEAGQVIPQGFVWRDGVIQNIGWIPTSSAQGSFATLSAISFDGRAIAGQARSIDHPGGEAFRWFDGEITLLGTLGGDTSYSTDISDDGSTVVGVSTNAAGAWRAFIWRTVMQDFTNILGSFGGLAEETELAVSLPRQRLARLEKAGCSTGTKSFCFGLGGYGWRGSAPVGVPKPDEAGIVLSAGVRPHRYVSLGASYDWADASTGLARIRADHSKAWSLAVRIADHDRLDGPVLEASYSRSSDQLVLERTAGIPDVEQALGSAKLRGEDYGARVSWALPLSPRLRFTPSASLARVELARAAFTEDAVDFPAGFDRLAWKATRLSAGATLAGSLSAINYQLGAGLSHELKSGGLSVSGRSDIPGAEQFLLESSLVRHRTRGEIEAAASIPLGPVSLVLTTEADTPEYGKRWVLGGSLTLKGAF